MENFIENFGINPEEEKRRREKILEMVDPRIAEILRKHLPSSASTTQEEQERVEVAPEVPPRNICNFKAHIELSQPRENDDKQ